VECAGNELLALARDLAPRFSRDLDFPRKGELHAHAPMAQDQAQGFHQRAVSGIGSVQVGGAVAQGIADAGSRNPRASAECGLEQRSVKGAQVCAVGGGAFRKDAHPFPSGQGVDDRAVGAGGVVALAALDEDGPGARHQPADHWPPADIGLRHEAHRAYAMDDPDVEPGYVVRHDHRRLTPTGRAAFHMQPDPQDGEHLARPALDDAQLPVAVDEREHDAGHGTAVDEVHQQTDQPIGAG